MVPIHAAPMGSEKQAGRNRLVHCICLVRTECRPGVDPSRIVGRGSYRVSSHVLLDILWCLQVCPAERTEDHRLLMILFLLAVASLV
jgi:hypothetical protein